MLDEGSGGGCRRGVDVDGPRDLGEDELGIVVGYLACLEEIRDVWNGGGE
jgi:hypothetical protein